MLKTAIIIPARYSSSRLPGKPLLRETGKYLIQHVYEQACRSRRASQVIVATDDTRIETAVHEFGGHVVMTRGDHATGTDRVAEVARGVDSEVIVNLQGDEPLIDPQTLDVLAELLVRNPEADMATLAVPIRSADQWRNSNCVKVVCDSTGNALYFSRSAIPHVRDGEPSFSSHPPCFLQHLGIYAYRRAFLLQLATLPPTPLELLEKLEQLRVLAHGHRIQVGIVDQTSIGVDTMEDYERFTAVYRQMQNQVAA